MKLTETQIEQLLDLPIWPSLTEEQIQQLIKLVEKFLETAR